MAEQRMATKIADIKVELGRFGGDRRFVVQNLGTASAYDVVFSIESEDGRNSPIIGSEHEKTFPVGELEAGHHVSLGAIITTGTGIHFQAVVGWRNQDDSREERSFQLSA